MNTRIKRSSSNGLTVDYNNTLSQSAQISIYWDNGLGGGVAMSIAKAQELQGLLTEVLQLTSTPVPESKFAPMLQAEGFKEAQSVNHGAVVAPMKTSATATRWPSVDAAFADACREFIKGCSCAPASSPKDCEDCRDAFINAVLERAATYGLEIGAYGLPNNHA